MANIVLFHSVLGVREGVLDAQDRLTALGIGPGLVLFFLEG